MNANRLMQCGRWSSLAALVILLPALPSCNKKQQCVDVSGPALQRCQSESEGLQRQIVDLKRLLAQALANPGTIKVDPTVLAVDGKPIVPRVKEGSLTQEQAFATIQQNKPMLKPCYERAMKKNPSLRRQTVTVTVALSVKPAGNAGGISITPNYDSMMLDCMRKVIMRWRFPTFTGQPVDIEAPIALTPQQ